MKNKYLGIFLMASVLTISGCGKKGGKTGTKTTKDVFLQATANLPLTHNFVYAEIAYDEDNEKGVEKYDFVNGRWVGQGQDYYQYVFDMTVHNGIDQLQMYEEQGVSVTYYTNPLSATYSFSGSDGDVKTSVTGTYIWNNYGLPTYIKDVEKDTYRKITETNYREITITYKTSRGGGGGSSDTSTSSAIPVTSVTSESTYGYKVNEKQWNSEMLLSNDQNYAFTSEHIFAGVTQTITGKYDGGKIIYSYDNGGDYYVNILWDTVNLNTRKGSIEYYYPEGNTYRKSVQEDQWIDLVSEATLRLPFDYYDFDFSLNDHTYKCKNATVNGITFYNIEVAFDNYHLARISFEITEENYTASFVGTYYGYNWQTVILPEAVPEPDPEPAPTREEFKKWAYNADETKHPYSEAQITMNIDNYPESDEYNEATLYWDSYDRVWRNNSGETLTDPIPTAKYIIEYVESLEKNLERSFTCNVSPDYREVNFYLDANINGDSFMMSMDARFDEYGYITYWHIHTEAGSTFLDETVTVNFYY